MDKILEDVVFQYCGIEKFPIGQSVGNEWDEMDSILRVMIEKTGVGEDLLSRFRVLKTHEDFISPEEIKSIEEKLKYWPNIYNEFVRCYNIFTKVAPEIYQKIDALKNYKGGIPALEFCFLVGCVKEHERMRTKEAVNKVLYGSGKNLLPTLS